MGYPTGGLSIPRSWVAAREGIGFATVERHCLHFLERLAAERLKVIRLLNHHCLHCWRQLDSHTAKNRGLLSLMRRHRHNLSPEQAARPGNYLAQHPALDVIYRFRQRLCYLLLKKHRTQMQCRQLAPGSLSSAGGPGRDLGLLLTDWRKRFANL